jgi:hypothetical protein
MKKFKQFTEDMVANSVGAGGVANYDPVMKFKMFRRKKKKNIRVKKEKV